MGPSSRTQSELTVFWKHLSRELRSRLPRVIVRVDVQMNRVVRYDALNPSAGMLTATQGNQDKHLIRVSGSRSILGSRQWVVSHVSEGQEL